MRSRRHVLPALASLPGALLLHACTTLPSPPPPAPSPPVASLSSSAPPAPTPPPTILLVPTVSASASASAPPPPPPLPARLTIEPSYHATTLGPPPGADARAFWQEIERWNIGGRGEGEKWHPVPRVVIEEPVTSRGRADTKSMMRHLRAEQYGAVRRCYDAELRRDPELQGRTVIRLTVGADGRVQKASSQGGRVPDKRKHPRAMSSATVRECLVSVMRAAHVPGARKGGATVAFSVDLYPGDVPLPEPDSHPSAARVELAEVDRLVAAQSSPLAACYQALAARAPATWGRLALRLDTAPDGHVREVREVDSTFPDAPTTGCVSEALRRLVIPPATPASTDTRLVVALRWAPLVTP